MIFQYTDRVTLQEDNSYCWRCTIEKEYERRSYRLTMRICVLISLLILGCGVIICSMNRDFRFMWVVAVCTAGFLLIAFLTCLIVDRLPGERKEIYRLIEDGVQTGSGRSRTYFEFKRTKQLIASSKYVELEGSVGGTRVYVPPEDMAFVRDYILSRMPGNAVIRYE